MLQLLLDDQAAEAFAVVVAAACCQLDGHYFLAAALTALQAAAVSALAAAWLRCYQQKAAGLQNISNHTVAHVRSARARGRAADAHVGCQQSMQVSEPFSTPMQSMPCWVRQSTLLPVVGAWSRCVPAFLASASLY